MKLPPYEQNEIGMLQSRLPVTNGFFSIIAPHKYCGNRYEVAYIGDDHDLEPERFDTIEEVHAYVQQHPAYTETI